jgi:diguanylate cyclase (GGDEF)-like protein/PAS domain S-box-containing protein
MDPRIFQKLSNYQQHRLLEELDEAAAQHQDWLAAVNRALLCGAEPGGEDACHLGADQCQLGRWIYGVDEPGISGKPAFEELGRVHQEVHQIASMLLEQQAGGTTLGREHYNALINSSVDLRQAIRRIQVDLKGDLAISGRLLAKLFENASEGVVVISKDMHILHVNNAFTQLTGYSEREVVGNAPDLLYGERDDIEFYEVLWINVRNRGFWQGELANTRRNGERFLERLSIYAITDQGGEIGHYLAIFSDITKEREKEDRLYKLAHFDAITGLPNRMLFQDRLRQEIAHARRHRARAAILYLDLDDFKAFNERYGRDIGDLLLERLTKRLEGLLRSSDSIGRFGGDEFLILVELTNEGDYEVVANKVLAELRKPFELDAQRVSISGSVGISLFPNHSSDDQELIRYADQAMYRAKIGGKNGYRLYSAEAAIDA